VDFGEINYVAKVTGFHEEVVGKASDMIKVVGSHDKVYCVIRNIVKVAGSDGCNIRGNARICCFGFS
jgi:hypothetical protein